MTQTSGVSKTTSRSGAVAGSEPPTAPDDPRYRAVAARDARFDGQFFSAITTTGIYCRPVCPARTPKPENVRFFSTAAAAQAAGFRACKRCHPQLAPVAESAVSPLAEDALQLISSGATVPQLAEQLQVSQRHVRRLLGASVGASPLTLTRNRRDQAARLLLETTAMPISDVAFTAGFGSLRQFDDAIRATFGVTPSALRKRALGALRSAADSGFEPEPELVQSSGALALRAAHRGPHDLARLLSWFGGRALTGVEELTGVEQPGEPLGYRRTVRLAHGPAIIGLSAGAPGSLTLTLDLDDQRDLAAAISLCRDLADLDADTTVITAALAADPVLAPLLSARPGLRIPGCADGFEMAVRAVLGQQVSVAAARTLANRIVARHGEAYDATGPLTHLFPTAARLAEADLDGLGITGARVRSVRALANAVADGGLTLNRDADRAAARTALLALPGIGPWTADYLALRALGDPDAFPVGDLVLRQSAARLSLPATEKGLAAHAERWRPWRGYAAVHLWADHSDFLKNGDVLKTGDGLKKSPQPKEQKR
jgi:AraC family transcriptional regulator of adaptative response / DNA-3-methyladenine glycosylase II